MRIEVQGLRKVYEKTVAVDEVSFTFSSGQIFGFVGPNGAGKTTTMRIMATLEEPTEGDVRYDGVSAIEEPEEVRALFGYMPDALPAYKDLSVEEYLDFFARAYRIRQPERTQRVLDIMEFTNLLGIREKLLETLSKGMKQRVSLARSILHDPAALIMDEPAAGLDPRARIELRELLKVLASQGKAILISSHILTELSEICTGAVIIEQGKMLRAGTTDELLERRGTHKTLVIRPLNRLEEFYRDLVQHPLILEARPTGREIAADFNGTEEESCELLAYLIENGWQIAEFRQHRAQLEEVFMNITKGVVQ